MAYYKLINGANFVGIATQHDFRRFQQKHGIILACDEKEAQYIQSNDSLYHANWMLPVTTETISYETVEVISIDEEEYNTLLDAIESGKDIEPDVEPEEPEIEAPPVDASEEVTTEYVREKKLSEMSRTCNAVITNGFDTTLSDGEQHHFSLTTQDQLNLITLSSMAASGEQAIPYHADDELCKFYTAEDINKIVSEATAFKTYHVSYFNSLKAYIESMEDMQEISDVTYGIEIPAEHQSDVLKVLLAEAANVS